MSNALTLPLSGTLGNIVGAGSDGVHVGALTPTDPAAVHLRSHIAAGLCKTEDGNLYTDEATPFNEATADDVEVLAALPAVNDAVYIGHATLTFARVDVNITTQGDWVGTVAWEYWDGTAWTALAGVTDGTSDLSAATGWVSVTFTLPTDWSPNTVDDTLGYWIRARVTAHTSIITPQQWGQGHIIVASANATDTDDTTDFTDVGAGDVDLLPAYLVVGDGIFITHGEKFCGVQVNVSQARTGTATLDLQYWNGTAWTAVTTVEDDSAGWSTGTSTYIVHFVPPSDWVANTAANGPGGTAGFTVAVVMTAITSVTAQPQATQGWVLPLVTGASGIRWPFNTRSLTVDGFCGTKSATNNDSVFLLVNVTTGAIAELTWTAGEAVLADSATLRINPLDELAVVQVTEDGTTELADVGLVLAT